MSKPILKKELQKLTKEQLIDQILDLYEKNKAVKEFYNFYLNPRNEKELAKKYKKLMRKELHVENPERGSFKFSIAKRIISDFKYLQPSSEALADVMLYLPECACEYTYHYGDMSGPFYNGAYNSFVATLKFLHKNDLLDSFKNRVEQCLKWASSCGYGFGEAIADVYHEYYQDE
ncbi:MAG: DUF6155 family protein [Bacteroidetes bacterium]|nr:DUF6155 family protein [Bacteroidota bacterium]MCL2301646.1 DUF6155 family protein [Lentimicrobiaceae bacterium]